jgi:uncharacterized SAM-binding protein YcdF (DUF218 family)
MLFAIVWSGAIAWFVHHMPTRTLAPTEKADAIVVLTGGKGRVEHGLSMLAQGAAPVLFISGVGKDVTRERIISEHTNADLREKLAAMEPEIILDYVARSTESNAGQTARFMRDRGIRRIRLVTANYHMKRSILEFSTASPDVAILPDPVFPTGFRRDEWWEHKNTRRLMFSEFYKYFAARLRASLQAPPSPA